MKPRIRAHRGRLRPLSFPSASPGGPPAPQKLPDQRFPRRPVRSSSSGTRWAGSSRVMPHPPPAPAARDRGGVISRIVTLGTPTPAPVLAAIAGGVVDTVPGKGGGRRYGCCSPGAARGRPRTWMPRCASDRPVRRGVPGDAGRALRAGSPELTALPKGSDVYSGGRARRVHAVHGAPARVVRVVVVDGRGARRGRRRDRVVRGVGRQRKRDIACRYQLNPHPRHHRPTRTPARVTGRNRSPRPRSGPGPNRASISLMRAQELANEVAGVVNGTSPIAMSRGRTCSRHPCPPCAAPGRNAGERGVGRSPGAFVKLERTGGAGLRSAT